MKHDCARAEILAGAIALDEATDAQRDDYRAHIAGCAACLRALGGEREIERVMATVAQARESEVWEPVARPLGARRAKRVRLAFAGVSALGAALVASLALHTLVAANVKPIVLARTQHAAADVFHVTIDRAASAGAQPQAAKTQPGILVVHNVITLKRDTSRAASKPAVRSATTTIVAEAPAPAVVAAPAPAAEPAFAKPHPSNVPIWRRNAPSRVAHTAQRTMRRYDGPLLAGRAESIAIAPSYIVRDALPVGGETAINPQPARIAYAQGAQGTTAFQVSIDPHGIAVKCTITKSSGYLSLDDAVCKAAMKARYTPRTVNGRPTAGIYRDAFTFRSENNSDAEL